MSYSDWGYVPPKRASTKPSARKNSAYGFELPHVGDEETTTASPKVHTPATTVTTGSNNEAFEVKVCGYGTDSPTFSITAPADALNNSQDGLNNPVKIIATVEHNGQHHEICSTFNSLKISNVDSEKVHPVTNVDANEAGEEEEEWYSPLDKVNALAMVAEEQLKAISNLASQQVALSKTKENQELFDLVWSLRRNIEKINSIGSRSSVFADTFGKEIEYLKMEILAEVNHPWAS